MGTTKFAHNNKIHLAIKKFPFKANYGQDPGIGFERRRYEIAGNVKTLNLKVEYVFQLKAVIDRQ